MPPEHWHLAVIRSHLGLAYLEAARYAEAEPLLLSSHAALQQQFGDADSRTATFRHRVADLYNRWNKPAEAARFQ